MNSKEILREWQANALNNVIDPLIKKAKKNKSEKSTNIPVAAAVGSGKTCLSKEAIFRYILANKNSNTVQCITCPTITLTKQTVAYINAAIDSSGNRLKGFNVEVIEVDCEAENKFNFNDITVNGHSIFVYCEASMFGNYTDGNGNKIQQFPKRYKQFKDMKSQNCKFGFFILDEAHNYCNYINKIFTEDFGKTPEKKTIQDFFQFIMPMTATPAAYQVAIMEHLKYKANTIVCSFKESLDNGWILKPSVYAICSNFYNDNKKFYTGLAVIIENTINEFKNKYNQQLRMIINCTSIEQIHEICSGKFFQENMGKTFNVCKLHSRKKVEDKNGDEMELMCGINNIIVNANIAKAFFAECDKRENTINHLENDMFSIDENNKIDMSLPMIIFQVDMISEGLNLNSVNATVITTTEHRKAMQQIGRVVRLSANKIHPRIFLFQENLGIIAKLIRDLSIQYSLTAECFDWIYYDVTNNGISGKDGIGKYIPDETLADFIADTKSIKLEELTNAIFNEYETNQDELDLQYKKINVIFHPLEYFDAMNCGKITKDEFNEYCKEYGDYKNLYKTVSELKKFYNKIVDLNQKILVNC